MNDFSNVNIGGKNFLDYMKMVLSIGGLNGDLQKDRSKSFFFLKSVNVTLLGKALTDVIK